MSQKVVKKILIGVFIVMVAELGAIFGMFIVKSHFFVSGINPLNVNGLPGAYVVTSGSMEPAITTGALVLSIPVSEYNAGDVITFRNSQNSKTLITHRIQAKIYSDEKKEFLYYTQGDANKTLDGVKITANEIVGKTIIGIPSLGFIANSLKDPKMFILFVIVPGTIVVYEELKFLKSEILRKIRRRIANAKAFAGDPKYSSNNPRGINKIVVLVPLLGIAFILTGITGSFFKDSDKSVGQVITTGTFPTPVPTISPSPSPTPSTERQAFLYNSSSFTCSAGASDFSQPQLTDVTFTKDGSNISVIVTLTGASPSSVYDIWLNQDPGACPLSSPTSTGAITTDPSGNGAGSASSTLVSGATKFWVSAVGGGQVLRSTAISF